MLPAMGVAREELYQQVWAEPMTTTAKRHGVSSNYLARICERLKVPRPPRGYWQQLAAGLKAKRPSLPDLEPGDELEWTRDGSMPRTQPITAALPRGAGGKRPSKHSLVVGVRAHFDKARVSVLDDGREYVRPYKRNLVDVFVSKEALGRALEAASELFLVLEDRGHRVMLAPSDGEWRHVACEPREGFAKREHDYYSSRGWSPLRPTVAFLGDLAIGLTVFEVSEDVEVRRDPTTGKYARVPQRKPVGPTAAGRLVRPRYDDWTIKHWMPTGRLAVHAYAPQHHVAWEQCWYEAKPGDLQGLYTDIALQLEAASPAIAELVEEQKRRAEEERRKWAAQQEEWRKQELEAERKRQEQHRREEEARRDKDFRDSIARWRIARDVREYVAETRALVEGAHLEITPGGELDRHLEWAAAYADRTDPLAALRAEVGRLAAEHDAKCDCRAQKRGAEAAVDRADTPNEAPASPTQHRREVRGIPAREDGG